jgi:phenylacetate-coenzyme A ligase PaaK-like adenylate-forming protein
MRGAHWTRRLRWSAHVAVHAPVQGRLPFRPSSRHRRAQGRRVRSSIEYAYMHVPYYRETMDRLGLRPRDFERAADLARLPIIERQHLQSDPEYFVARRHPSDSCVKLQSGGSTGEPITVFRDLSSVCQLTVVSQRQRSLVARLAGRLVHLREVRISPPTSSGRQVTNAFRDQSLVSPRILSSVLRLSMLEPPSKIVSLIDEFKPDVVRTYGSYLEALFVYLKASGRRCHLPKVVSYSADALSHSSRRLISTEFGIPVLSRYQAVEAGQVGFECEANRGYHLNVDVCPIRIVDPEGRDTAEGSSGEVVISDLTNRATVLLNYRLGDIASMLPGPCPCGRSLPMISFLEGRRTEWLRSSSGALIHPQAVRMLLGTEQEVLRYQVIQRRAEHFDLLIVAAGAADEGRLRHRLVGKFLECFGPTATVAVYFVDDLPRTPGKKVQTVISAYKDSPVKAARDGAL